MHAFEAYFNRLHEIRDTQRATPELSYRAALENLLNTVGDGLDPAVQATAELADTGAGRPDFGFFEVRSGNSRGAVEVKPVEEGFVSRRPPMERRSEGSSVESRVRSTTRRGRTCS